MKNQEKQNKRFKESVGSKLTSPRQNGNSTGEALILKSPTDIGVRRNKGRNGARFAPATIENLLKKLNNHLPYTEIISETVAQQADELQNYEQSMADSANRIHKAIQRFAPKKTVHLGGGHDHALPLLRALDKSSAKNILVINFDAHCDTRIDEIQHSGTPFRDFDREARKPFHLVQIGIHDYANSPETLSPLKNNSEEIFYTKDLEGIYLHEPFVDAIFSSCPFEISKDTALFISIDCDALASSVMSAVSAVNHNGIEPSRLLKWIDFLKDFPSENKVLGIYEYNPLFEDLSNKGARYMAGLIYNYLL